MMPHSFSNFETRSWHLSILIRSPWISFLPYIPIHLAWNNSVSSFLKHGMSSVYVWVFMNVSKLSCCSISILQNLILSILDCLRSLRFSISHLINGAINEVINPPAMAEPNGTIQLCICTSPGCL